MGPAPQIYAPDDPRQGLLNTLIGDSDWKYQNEFGAGNKPGEGYLGKQETGETAGYQYRLGEIGAQEPGAYQSNANRANRGGLLHSGINAKRHETIASKFANQRFWQSKQHNEAQEGFGHQRETGQHGYEQERTTKIGEATANNWLEDQAAKRKAAETANTGLGASGAPSAGAYTPAQSQNMDEEASAVYARTHPQLPPKVQWSRNPSVREKQMAEIRAGRLRA